MIFSMLKYSPFCIYSWKIANNRNNCAFMRCLLYQVNIRCPMPWDCNYLKKGYTKKCF